jgi:hypothetical protein
MRTFPVVRCSVFMVAIVWIGCGSDVNPRLDTGEGPLAPACRSATVAQREPLPGSHVDSNPPSSGPHCSSWGKYAVFGVDKPLPRCNYVHNLEHGAGIILHRCRENCDEAVEALRRAAERLRDPDCTRTLVVITYDPEIATDFAAAVWGSTWHADCLDSEAIESLTSFLDARLGARGSPPESKVCADGNVSPDRSAAARI